jgi:hypothetical protein
VPETDPQLRAYVDAFEDQTLDRDCWNHAGHLLVGWTALSRHGRAEAALPILRDQIERYNRTTSRDLGRGYHETLTRYFLTAIERLGAPTFGEVLAAPSCAKTAPARLWSPEVLASATARHHWIVPDRRPLSSLLTIPNPEG